MQPFLSEYECADGNFSGILDLEHPDQDDFEFWSPAEEREERCLFGRRVRFLPNIK